ncbi:energy-coupling factor transporter ATPase [Bifidobacterium choloepi]|uniref:energy-coupling factor transporter ATPase n=1 Tax=Bifidobacterium choloepi TaxID=2614131 RepID=UPI002F2B4C4B
MNDPSPTTDGPAGDDVIALDDVRFSYDGGATWALDGITLRVRRGERCCLVGANGSGKSTLSRLMAALAAPDGGTVRLAGRTVFSDADGARPDAYRQARRLIGAVFQNPADQIVTTTVEDDVAFGPENLAVPAGEIGERIRRSLADVSMGDARRADPTNLSGGQQQRVAIAGQLAMDSRTLVLDEPTAMLDPDARLEVLATLDRLQEHGVTIVLVTHHDDEIRPTDHVVRLDHGHVVFDGTGADPCPVAGAGDPAVRAPEDTGAPVTTPLDEGSPFDDAPAPAVRFRHVTFGYPDAEIPAIDDVSVTIRRGETVALIGHNGSGKTTFARLLAGLETPQHGEIAVDGLVVAAPRRSPLAALRRTASAGLAADNDEPYGNDWPKGTAAMSPRDSEVADAADREWLRRAPSRRAGRRERRELHRRVGYVMQHPERQLFADTVADDVAFGPKSWGLSGDDVHARVVEALELAGILDLADRRPGELSGGQRRLAAIAGVLACRPSVLVMDEPTAGLDAAARRRIHDVIRQLKLQGVTVLLVTHAMDEVSELADRIVLFGAPPRSFAVTPDKPARKTRLRGRLQQVNRRHLEGANSQRHWQERRARAAALANGQPDPAPAAVRQAAPSFDRVAAASSQESSTNERFSWVSSLDPRVKALGFLVLMFSAFAMSSWWAVLVGAVVAVGLVAASRIRPSRLLRQVHAFLALFLVMGLLNVFVVRSGTPLWTIGRFAITDDGVDTALLYMARFSIVIVLGAVMLETTTPTALTDAFGSLLSPLRALHVHAQEIALVLSLALRFLPTLGAEAKAIVEAQGCRGGSVDSGSPCRRMRAMCAVVVPMFAAALRHADNLSLALDARCYEEGLDRTHWRRYHVGPRDVAFAGIVAAQIVAIVLLQL